MISSESAACSGALRAIESEEAMPEHGPMTVGKVAFEAYRERKMGSTYDGKPIPPWGEVGDAVRDAWEAAAAAVLASFDTRSPELAIEVARARVAVEVKPGRERALVLTRLEEAGLWLTRCERVPTGGA